MSSPSSSYLLAHCPVCHAAYPASDIRLLGERGPARFFHCTCGACGNAVLAVVLDQGGSMSSIGLVTDLEAQDAVRFREALPISTDECVAIHKIVTGDTKAFCEALLRPKAPKASRSGRA